MSDARHALCAADAKHKLCSDGKHKLGCPVDPCSLCIGAQPDATASGAMGSYLGMPCVDETPYPWFAYDFLEGHICEWTWKLTKYYPDATTLSGFPNPHWGDSFIHAKFDKTTGIWTVEYEGPLGGAASYDVTGVTIDCVAGVLVGTVTLTGGSPACGTGPVTVVLG